MIISLSLSLVCNVSLVIWLYLQKRKYSGKSKEPNLTTDANQLLSELLKGGAVCVTQIIDPSQIFYYSPKDR